MKDMEEAFQKQNYSTAVALEGDHDHNSARCWRRFYYRSKPNYSWDQEVSMLRGSRSMSSPLLFRTSKGNFYI